MDSLDDRKEFHNPYTFLLAFEAMRTLAPHKPHANL
jgi:hypothetical protein